jgi:hypothetical protein
MALKLVEPRKRGNKFWLAYGSLDGKIVRRLPGSGNLSGRERCR